MSNETHTIRHAMIQTGQPAQDQAVTDSPTTTAELRRDFEVPGFASPFVVAGRRSDGLRDSLEFIHSPRVYFHFKEDS